MMARTSVFICKHIHGNRNLLDISFIVRLILSLRRYYQMTYCDTFLSPSLSMWGLFTLFGSREDSVLLGSCPLASTNAQASSENKKKKSSMRSAIKFKLYQNSLSTDGESRIDWRKYSHERQLCMFVSQDQQAAVTKFFCSCV